MTRLFAFTLFSLISIVISYQNCGSKSDQSQELPDAFAIPTGEAVSLEGTVRQVILDLEGFRTSKTIYEIDSSEKKSITLQSVGKPFHLEGNKRYRIKGIKKNGMIFVDNSIPAINIESIPTPPPLATGQAIEKNIFVTILSYKSNVTAPTPARGHPQKCTYRNVVNAFNSTFDSGWNIPNFYEKMSNGALTVHGFNFTKKIKFNELQVDNVVNCKLGAPVLNADGTPVLDGSGNIIRDGSPYNLIKTWADRADKKIDSDLANKNYKIRFYVLPPGSECGFGGVANIGTSPFDNSDQTLRGWVMPYCYSDDSTINSDADFRSVLGHELGHTFGLGHGASAVDNLSETKFNQIYEYDDLSTVMGYNYTGLLAPLNGPQLERLGWIQPQILNVPAEAVSVYPLHSKLGMEVYKFQSHQKWYYISFLVNDNFAEKVPTKYFGLSIYGKFEPDLSRRSYLLATLKSAGEEYDSPIGKFKVKYLGGSTPATFSVNLY